MYLDDRGYDESYINKGKEDQLGKKTNCLNDSVQSSSDNIDGMLFSVSQNRYCTLNGTLKSTVFITSINTSVYMFDVFFVLYRSGAYLARFASKQKTKCPEADFFTVSDLN